MPRDIYVWLSKERDSGHQRGVAALELSLRPCEHHLRILNNVKSSTAGSEHTPHPFYSHLSQSSCVKRRLGHSSSATYGLHSLASNTNPQSSSSYSLRVLSSHHEIFRAPFLIIGLKDCQSSSPARQKLSAKHSRETCFPKSFIPRKTLSLQVATICELPKQVQAQLGPSPTQEKHAPTSSYHFNYFTTTT